MGDRRIVIPRHLDSSLSFTPISAGRKLINNVRFKRICFHLHKKKMNWQTALALASEEMGPLNLAAACAAVVDEIAAADPNAPCLCGHSRLNARTAPWCNRIMEEARQRYATRVHTRAKQIISNHYEKKSRSIEPV
jgi:hypothetical protein